MGHPVGAADIEGGVSDRAPHASSLERGRAGPRTGRRARRAGGRPVRRRGRRGAGQGGRALASAAALARPRYRRQATASAPTSSFPWPSTLVDEALAGRPRPSTPTAVERWAPAAVACGRCSTSSTRRSPAEPWCRSLAQHLGTDGRGQGPPARGGAPAGAAVRRVRPVPAGDAARLGGRPRRARRRQRRSTTTSPGRPSCGAGSARRLGTPSPAELLDDACATLRDHPELSALPDRLSVFGASRLSPARLQVLAALAEHRDVHLWLHHSSPALWDTVAAAPPALRRKDDDRPQPAGQPAAHHPVPRRPRAAAAHRPLGARARRRSCTGRAAQTGTLLGRLKQDLADDRVPADAAAARPRRPQRRRCTPATAAPGRSRCSARSSSACSPTTPRSSRATSSSCAPTSRPSPRSSRPPSRSAPRTTPRTRRPGCGSGSPTEPSARPTRCSPCSSQLLELGTARLTASAGARPRRHPRRPAAVRVRRRRARTAARLDRRRRRPLGPGRGPPRHLAPRRRRAGQLARRPRPAAARCGDGGQPSTAGATSYRSTTSTARTSTWPAGSPSWSTGSPPPSN